ncbi:hypothetical protein JX265_013365 [Neoarthrinium moseri]|uniref:Uncharacterized protein n=1 Tax=Neoarthrinium moseri TaxID=1658444 RepID=A0A9P9W8T8_9PEZI|nr:uncharacterized protein JN550_012199 [Neoarthrinium moseri]KAI1847240.1 hypothetical protein JX266_006780 [Neoarthrinium moseri]KAI1850802.1 hypothetical protein JX265_013365 [Neoarthrinium moseri]KAI1859186.1 hypothetical protein JN550_012199 [Neoarthrinium moseri]
MAPKSHASAAGTAYSNDKMNMATRHSHSVNAYVTSDTSNPTAHLALGSGKATSPDQKVKKTKEKLDAWDKAWRSTKSNGG